MNLYASRAKRRADYVKNRFELEPGPPGRSFREPDIVESLATLSKTDHPCITLKESFLPVDRHSDEAVFSKCQGRFGIPSIITSYKVRDWSSLGCEDAKPWPIYIDNPNSSPHELNFVRTLYKTRGYPLSYALGPWQLVEGILHGMIGLSSSFTMALTPHRYFFRPLGAFKFRVVTQERE